jgi:hypothetical protein
VPDDEDFPKAKIFLSLQNLSEIMNNKMLGTLALAGAPFLFIGLTYEQLMHVSAAGDTRLGGAYSFIYMAAWTCSLLGLLRIGATGHSRFGRGILWANITTLALANILNLAQLIFPWAIFKYFRLVLDPFWPISHVLMLVIGINVLASKKLMGWKRYVPLAIGLWLPVALLTKLLPAGTMPAFNIIAFYSAVAWSLLAIVVRTTPEKPESENVSIETGVKAGEVCRKMGNSEPAF